MGRRERAADGSAVAGSATPGDAHDVGAAARPRASWAMPPVFVVLWSSAFVAAVFGTGAAPPLLLTFARFAVAGVLLAGIALAARAPWPRGRQLAHVAVTGLLMQAVQFGAFYLAIGKGLPGGVVALIQGLNPVVIALLAFTFLGEGITRVQWVGFGVGAVGVGLAVADEISFSPTAVALCFVGLLGLSVGTVYQKRFTAGTDIRSGTALHFLLSAPVVALASLLLETPRVTDWRAFGGALAWIVLVNSVATFLLLNAMLRRQSASRVGTLFFLTPGVTAVLSWLVVGQRLDTLAIAGLVLGGIGVLLATHHGAGPGRPGRGTVPARQHASPCGTGPCAPRGSGNGPPPAAARARGLGTRQGTDAETARPGEVVAASPADRCAWR